MCSCQAPHSLKFGAGPQPRPSYPALCTTASWLRSTMLLVRSVSCVVGLERPISATLTSPSSLLLAAMPSTRATQTTCAGSSPRAASGVLGSFVVEQTGHSPRNLDREIHVPDASAPRKEASPDGLGSAKNTDVLSSPRWRKKLNQKTLHRYIATPEVWPRAEGPGGSLLV
jgi:hypothetical protein